MLKVLIRSTVPAIRVRCQHVVKQFMNNTAMEMHS